MRVEVDFKSSVSIGTLARAHGLRASAIRYYERLGLLPPAPRVGGKRVYGRDADERLRRIRLAQDSGFSLDEIKALEKGMVAGATMPERWRRLATVKLEEVEAQIRRLREMRALLHRTLRCGCSSLTSCPLLREARSSS
jgi:MerR family transcriptional regulator, redox-sensitive transcriptional activator SoxR